MADSEPMCELHLRMAGQPHDVTLRLHDNEPTEEDVAAWMRDGAVIRLRVSETGSRAPHTMLVNFGGAVFAWLVPYRAGRRIDL